MAFLLRECSAKPAYNRLISIFFTLFEFGACLLATYLIANRDQFAAVAELVDAQR